MHGWGTSLVGIGPMKTGYGGNFIDEVVNVGTMDVETLGALFADRGPRDRGVHRRAGHRRRRRDPAGAALLARGHPPLPRARHPAHRRRGDHRVRADREAVGLAALRHRARPDHVRQGRHVGLPVPLGGVLVGRAGPGAVLGRATCPAPCSATATPTPATRARPRRRWPTSTSSRARTWSSGWPPWSPCWMPRSGGSRAAPGVGEIRTVGLTGGRRVPAGPARGRSRACRSGA